MRDHERSLRGLRDAPKAPRGRLLRVLLVCGPRLPAEADGFLSLAEASFLGFQSSLLLGWNGGVEPSGDVPAEGATQGAALADALGRAAAASAGWVVEPLNESHGGNLRRDRHHGPFLSTSIGLGCWAIWAAEPSSHAGSAKRGLAHSTGPFGRNELLLPGCRRRRGSRIRRHVGRAECSVLARRGRVSARVDDGSTHTAHSRQIEPTKWAIPRARSTRTPAGVEQPKRPVSPILWLHRCGRFALRRALGASGHPSLRGRRPFELERRGPARLPARWERVAAVRIAFGDPTLAVLDLVLGVQPLGHLAALRLGLGTAGVSPVARKSFFISFIESLRHREAPRYGSAWGAY